MTEKDQVRLSKRLSRILRHRRDIPHDEHGWFLIDDVEKLGGMDRATVLRVAGSSGRYEVSEDGTRIRAYHGHSIDIEYENEVEPPEHLYHGTSAEAWASIRECGSILPMRRCEVHLTASLDYADEIALRRGRCRENTVILVIDARRMWDDGYVFHLSGDGTYLVKNVPVGYVEPLESRHPERGSDHRIPREGTRPTTDRSRRFGFGRDRYRRVIPDFASGIGTMKSWDPR